MAYELAYQPTVFDAPASARAAFIRRTYGHLAGAVLAFIGLEALLLQLPGIEALVGSMAGSGYSWLVVLLAFMGVSWLANYWAHSNTSPALQYAGLSLYVVAEAVIFLPLLYFAKLVYPAAIPTAALLTGSIFLGLTAIVFVTRKDFSFLRTILVVASFLALGLIVASIFIGFDLGLLFSFALAVVACGFILYDTSNVLHHYRTDQHVAAALCLFASVALLFWYILRILLALRR